MQTAQEFLDSWDCPDCGNSGAVYIDGEEYPCMKCEQAAATYRKMKKAEAGCDDIPEDGHKVGKVKDLYISEKRMVMVQPLHGEPIKDEAWANRHRVVVTKFAPSPLDTVYDFLSGTGRL